MRVRVLGEKLRVKNENERSEERELRFGMKLLNFQECARLRLRVHCSMTFSIKIFMIKIA